MNRFSGNTYSKQRLILYNPPMEHSAPMNRVMTLVRSESDRLKHSRREGEVFFLLQKGTDSRFLLRAADARGADLRPGSVSGRENEQRILDRIQAILRRKEDPFYRPERIPGLFLDEYPALLPALIEEGVSLCLNVPGNPLETSPVTGHVELEVTPRGPDYEARAVLCCAGELLPAVVPVCPDYVLCGRTLYGSRNLGSHYNHLADLKGKINSAELESYLSLCSTLFPAMRIRLEDYTWREPREAAAERGMSFENLLDDGTLKLSAVWHFESFSVDFMTACRPRRVIKADHENRNLTPVNLRYPEEETSLKSLERELKHMAKQEGLEDAFLREEDALYLTAPLALPFLSRNLGSLTREFRLFGTESLGRFKLKQVRPKAGFTLSSGIDFFEGTGSIRVENDEFSIEEALRLFEEHNYIPLSDGSKGIVDPGYFHNLKRLMGRLNRKEGTCRVSLFDLPLIQELIDGKIEGDGMVRCREVFEGFNTIGERPLPPAGLTSPLREYQGYGVRWLEYLQSHGLGGCLADDMGLGKTIQTIAVLSALYTRDPGEAPSLIVMPRSLLHNWEKEIRRFAPHLSVRRYYGSGRNLKEVLDSQVILTTYALVRNDIEILKERKFCYLVLDEAQAIKNLNANISKAVMLLEGSHRLALSGTPVENHIGEVYSLFRFLNPAMFGSLAQFKREYLKPIQKDRDPEASRILAKKLSPFVLRRLKQQVARELPGRTEQVIYVEMEGEQKRLYEQRRSYYEKIIRDKVAAEGVEKSQFLILQGLLELRQLASVPESKSDGEAESAKWEALLEHLEEVVGEGHRCLVFTNFLDTVEILQRKLEERGIGHLWMTGSTRNRAALVEQFQESERYKVFLMTLKTGGVGLNLTGADYVYITDPWWNRSAEQQAIDRTHRIGQTRSVFCYRLISRGTIEEKMLELQERKQELFDSVISSDGGALKSLSPEDIDYLLSREERDA